jgi:hypothetical protein
MTTSGSVDFTLNSRQIIDAALQLIGVLQEGDSPSTARANEAATSLNMMLKTWGASERLWLMSEGIVTLVAGQASYSLGVGVRTVQSVRRRVAGLDTPLTELSRSEYQDTPTKASIGLPNSWWFDRQRTTRTLYVWMVPDAAIAAQYTLPYTYTRVIEDIDTLDNDPDVPQEWLEVLTYNLAVRLGPRYGGIDTPEWAEIKTQAADLMALLPTRDQEESSVYISPRYQ